MIKTLWLMIALLVLASVAVGCGGASSTTVTETVTVTEEATEEAGEEEIAAEEVSSEAGAVGRQIYFDLTDGDGWHYEGSVPYPEVEVEFTKDVHASPPGRARPKATLSGTAPEPMEFAVDNPGRPGGPVLTVGPGYFAYDLPESFGDESTFAGPDEFPPCFLTGNSSYSFEPYNTELACELSLDEDPNSEELRAYEEEQEGDGDEAQVEHLLRVLREFGKPMYVINFNPIATACNMFIQPDGTVEPGNSYDESSCGTIDLKVK